MNNKSISLIKFYSYIDSSASHSKILSSSLLEILKKSTINHENILSSSSRLQSPSTDKSSKVKNKSQALVMLEKFCQNKLDAYSVTKHFSQTLIKKGVPQDSILANVSAALRLKYQISNPVEEAVKAVRPIIIWRKLGGFGRPFAPAMIPEKTQSGIAIRWIIEAARSKKYRGIRDLQMGLVDELSAILDGTSSLYQKRFMTHRNPN